MSRHTDQKAGSSREPSASFNWWQSKRRDLDKIFFRDNDFIRKGTTEYDDFWSFFEKYQAYQRRQQSLNKETVKTSTAKAASEKSLLGIPTRYDKRYRINFAVTTKELEDRLRSHRNKKEHEKEAHHLTPERMNEFKLAMLHYIDFNQKQQFGKLVKLRRDQANLPIANYRERILAAVRANPVVVVAGDTGCGKSTQVPQYLLAAGFTDVACTQPRRIACISLAKRVSYETLDEYGSEVAYQIRFETSKTRHTKILFLTEGLLLRQISSDPVLSRYNVVVIDEVHERHLHTDFLLGVLKCVLQQRPDLKVVLMSATINIHLFSQYFDQAPVIQVPGRLYPIRLEYLPITREEQTSKSERLDPRPYLRILQRIDHKYPASERGDLLIFLSGMAEISIVVEAAKAYSKQTQSWIVLQLHSMLSIAEQDKVFDIAPEGVRKCIVSTNIAETSVTIDGIRFIADSGKVKEMNYDSGQKMQKLQEFWISKASAEQRKGRAGRTGPGVCFRLYEESDYAEFQEYSTPEIHRVPLDSLLLQMFSMGLPDARVFPFIEPPPAASIENSICFLKEQGALTPAEQLTPIGHMLANLPVDVTIGKLLIMGTVFHIIEPVLSIAAALSLQSPFTSRAHTDLDACHARKPLESDHGDPFTLLNAFDEWVQLKAKGQGQGGYSKKWCRKRGLEEQRFYEMSKLRKQFQELLFDHGLFEKNEERYYSSDERKAKYRERTRLRQLKREHKGKQRRRKVLKLEQEDVDLEVSEEEESGSVDIADIDFKLTHNLDQMQEVVNVSRSLTLRDVNLLKVVLCSGLYPQMAIADDCNSYRKDSDQIFHTKSKPFVVLHPTGMFASNPDALRPQVTLDTQAASSKIIGDASSKHLLIAYVSLLETTKPYLVNTMRVPALQTLTLYAQSLDTNHTCTRIVADGWIEFGVESEEVAQQLISNIVQLRSTWAKLLVQRLAESKQRGEESREKSSRSRRLERTLAEKLTEFLDARVVYTMKRVSSTEMSHLYLGPDSSAESSSDSYLWQQGANATPHPTKGGIQVNQYLTFACLRASGVSEGYASVLRQHWTCPRCQTPMVITLLERMQHEEECSAELSQPDEEETGASTSAAAETSHLKKIRKPYFCQECQQEYQFTTTEIIKHKRSHNQAS